MEKLKDYQQRKIRGASVSDVLNGTLEADYDEVFVVGVKDNIFDVGYSYDDSIKSLGMLEVIKNHILQDMSE